MYGKVKSSCVAGIDGHLIDVEVDISNGLPGMHVVGLPDSSVRESLERVRAAIRNCGFTFPMKRITINLAPADMRKEGSAFDLAIAVGILVTSGQLKMKSSDEAVFLGELALDGSVRSVPGVLPMTYQAKKSNMRHVVLPMSNKSEAAMVESITPLPLSHLSELAIGKDQDIIEGLAAKEVSLEREMKSTQSNIKPSHEDYADVRGQQHAKRALTIAAAGMHNILFIGPPGSGKTMLMRRLPGILPPLDEDEMMQVTKIYSVANLLKSETGLIRSRPFRSPHHSITRAGLTGGGRTPCPGELSLAHYGVLYLDEMPEYPRHVLEALRQPMEDKQITISRARSTYTYPTDFLLAASMNPCPCGFYGVEETHDSTSVKRCQCHLHKIQQYRAKISGPLADRIDLQVEVPRLDIKTLTNDQYQMSTADMLELVLRARFFQKQRYKNKSIRYNQQLHGAELTRYCALEPQAEKLLQQSFEMLRMSARSYEKVIKVARTIADLHEQESILVEHIAEALQYRILDRN